MLVVIRSSSTPSNGAEDRPIRMRIGFGFSRSSEGEERGCAIEVLLLGKCDSSWLSEASGALLDLSSGSLKNRPAFRSASDTGSGRRKLTG